MTAPATPELEQRASRKVAAEITAAEARLAAAEAKIPELERAYVEAQAAEDAAWPGDDATVDSEAYGTWAALADTAASTSQELLRQYGVQRAMQQQLAALASDEHRVALLQKMAADEQRFSTLRARQARPAAPARVVQPDPPGTEELRATVDANKEAWKAYNAATAAGDEATRDALRPQYQAYRRAYRGLLDARKAVA